MLLTKNTLVGTHIKNTKNSDIDSDDDKKSNIDREKNHVYFYSEVSRDSVFTLNAIYETQQNSFIPRRLN